jgi:uridylate kinase
MTVSPGYRRALIKISGEALAGDRGFGLDPEKITWIAQQIVQARDGNRELGVVVGGGNILRGADCASVGVPPLVADGMGMIATVLNAMALAAALTRVGVPARAMSAFPVGKFVEPFDMGAAASALAAGSVIVFGGGTGNPCFTTDSAAALRAVEIDAEVMIKGTQVRGVFDRDPKNDPNAVFFESLTTHEVLSRGLRVIDATSVEILGRKRIPIIVLDLHKDGNLGRALAGEKVGTIIEAS